MKRYLGQVFECANGVKREFGVWYNFGGNVSVKRISPNGYRMRNDDSGEIIIPAGPASRDSLRYAIYNGECPRCYAHFCFGDEFKEAA